MAQQIKKKFIAPDAVGASQILIEQGQSVRVQDGSNVLELVKYDAGSGKMKVLGNNIAAYVSDIDAEKTRAQAAEQALGARIDSVISNVDPAAVDSLSEVVTAFQAADSNLYNAVVALGNSSGAGLSQEIADRQAADLVLDGKITTEVQAREAADLALGQRIDGEITARESADLVLDGKISQETLARQAALALKLDLAGGTMSGDIDMGGKNLINALHVKANFLKNKADEPGINLLNRMLLDAAGTAKLSWADVGYVKMLGNVVRGVAPGVDAGDAVNKGQMDSAIGSASSAANTYVDQAIAQEVSDRDAAIMVEKLRAEGVEAALGVRIDNLLTNTDATALNSLAEIVAEFQSVDGNLQTAINNLAASASTDLTAEVQARQAADLVLDGKISTEASAREASDLLLDGKITAEAQARQAADQALDARLDALEADPVTKAYVDLKDADLQAQIYDVDGYAQDIRADLELEVLARAAADSALQVRVAALEAATDGPLFARESFVAASPLTHIDLAMQVAENSLNVFVGRLALHMGEDYSVSVVAGKTRLTWMGDFAVGGVEAIAEGDKIFVNYAYLA